jgi:hypothetical protein
VRHKWVRLPGFAAQLVILRGASKIKLKNANKKRTVTVRKVIFLEFLKASIADLITLLHSSLQNSFTDGCGYNWVQLQVDAATAGCGYNWIRLQLGAATGGCGYNWVRPQLGAKCVL